MVITCLATRSAPAAARRGPVPVVSVDVPVPAATAPWFPRYSVSRRGRSSPSTWRTTFARSPVVSATSSGSICHRTCLQTSPPCSIFDAHACKATFFVLGCAAHPLKPLLRRTIDVGHEVASHGREREFCFPSLRGYHWTSSSRAYHWKAVRAAAGWKGSLYPATRHFAGWSRVNVLEMPSENVAIALGHTDGDEQVRRLYGHRDTDRALDRVIAPYAQAGTVEPLRVLRRETEVPGPHTKPHTHPAAPVLAAYSANRPVSRPPPLFDRPAVVSTRRRASRELRSRVQEQAAEGARGD